MNEKHRKAWRDSADHMLWMLCALLLVQCATRPSQPSGTTPTMTTPTAPHPTATPMHGPVSTQTPVASVTPVPTPTPTEVAIAGPVIAYFHANVEEANPGDTILLEWQSSGASAALLYALSPSGQLPQSGWRVAPSGSYAYSIPSDARNGAEFMLYVQGAAGGGATANLRVKLRCPVAWFFAPAPTVCASALEASNAAEQHFQHGVMLWVEERRTIFVLYDDAPRAPRWGMFADEWAEGQVESDPNLVPPAGLYQPVRGFGLVWRTQPEVRERLGWAVDQEAGFRTLLQSTTLFKYNSLYLRALDGNVWRLGPERGSLEKMQVTG